jgi:hypothetical protein
MTASTGEVPARIFMTYRREDTAYPAAWLFDRLASHFGRAQVFKDIDSIELGDDFVEVITAAVGSCDVLLALIGDRWLTVRGPDGRRRVDDPGDFVRLEIEAALARNVRVIPILVQGAQMPRADELPASLSKLARRQALELSPARFDADTQKLLRQLDRTITEAQQARQEAERATERRRQVEQLQQRLRERSAAREWDAVVAASDELAGLDPAAANPDGLASAAREQVSRRPAQMDVRTVEKVLVTLKDEEIAELVRREMRRLQGPDGSIRRSQLVKSVSDELPPGSFDDIRRIIELMRQNGEIEYAGNFDTALSLHYRPTVRKSASAARQESEK